jgi:glycosyl hydrolase family 106( putative alpha-L-rhamnosidase)
MKMKTSLTFKTVLVGLALILAAGCSSEEVTAVEDLSDWTSLNPVTALTAETFANPPSVDWPWVRWNFSPETATLTELEAELIDMNEAGINGVEIGQGGEPTLEQVVAILKKANQLGIRVSFKSPAGSPSEFAATRDLQRQTLRAGRTVVDAGAAFNGPLPEAPPPPVRRFGRGRRRGAAQAESHPADPGTIVAVLAYRCSASPCPTSGGAELDRASVIDLTSTVTNTNSDGFSGGTTAGTINWTAPAMPAGAQWTVFTVRALPFETDRRQPELLSRAGTDHLIAAYESYWTPEIKELLAANRGDIFVDSHATDPWGVPEELWSTNMASEFRARAGYDLIPNLAALIDGHSFSDGSARRILSDLYRVRGDLFIENRIKPFTEWAHQYNLTLRLQPEGADPIPDQIQLANVLERPEHESLAGGDQIDVYRVMASANHMNGNTWYSTECCAASGLAYLQTFEDVIVRMNKSFAGGMTKLVYHTYDYLHSPTATWPGHSHFGDVRFSNSWKRSQPYWADARTVNDFFSRNQQVLTQGVAKVDVAVYMQSYSQIWRGGQRRYWSDLELQRAGYTWDYLSPASLELPIARVTNNRLAESGPGYRALIFDSTLLPSANTAQGTLTIGAARRMLGYANDGLPIIIVGAPPSQTPGQPASQDAELQEIVTELVAHEQVHQVAAEADVPALLAKLGIGPAAKPDTPSTLFSVRRWDAGTSTNYYFLYNQGVDQLERSTSSLFEVPEAARATGDNPHRAVGEPIDLIVTLDGSGSPYLMDAWSGTIVPIAEYTSDGEHVTVRVKLGRDASTIIALSPDPGRSDMTPAEVHVTATTADSAFQVGDSIVVRSSQAGTYETQLSDGSSVTSKIEAVPAAIDLTSAAWRLEAEDWQPANPYGATGEEGAETRKVPVSVNLNGLRPWPDIPELANASGIGVYTTTVDLPSDWNASYGATLSLGQILDSFTLTVNERSVPIDQLQATADIGSYLKAGANTIVVRVATTLNNRLAALSTDVRDRGVIQEYGLVGPVVLTPYAQVTVWE